MPVDAPENPLDASGAFSRKLSVRRDTYQLIFTGASANVRYIASHAPHLSDEKERIKDDARATDTNGRNLSPNFVVTRGVTLFRISEPTAARCQQKFKVNVSDLFITITKAFRCD